MIHLFFQVYAGAINDKLPDKGQVGYILIN
jgi:hypothetical protein